MRIFDFIAKVEIGVHKVLCLFGLHSYIHDAIGTFFETQKTLSVERCEFCSMPHKVIIE